MSPSNVPLVSGGLPRPSKRFIAWLLLLLELPLLAGALFLWRASQPSAAPPALAGLHLVRDVVLPSIALQATGQPAIGGLPFDRFDFQGFDPVTGRLFISHPGLSAAKCIKAGGILEPV